MKFKALLSVMIAIIIGAGGCASGPDDNEVETIPYVINIRPDGSGGYKAGISGAISGSGWEIDYPGVTAFRCNNKIGLLDPIVAFDGGHLSIKLLNSSAKDIDRLWLRVSTGGGAELLTDPTVVNGKGWNMFVLGPLPSGDSIITGFSFNVLNPDGFTIHLDFMEIHERVAFSSDLADVSDPERKEIFTVKADGTDLYQVTRNGEYFQGRPSWSPGGEWIAFEKTELTSCGSTVQLRNHIYYVHPDGSNLTEASGNMHFSESPTFNPTGELISFACRPSCLSSQPDLNICVYNILTGELKTVYRGDPYYENSIFSPQWSPDGRYMVMRAYVDVDPPPKLMVYGRVDPLTGDSLSPLYDFMRGNYYETETVAEGDRQSRLIFGDGWIWAPDSRYGVSESTYYERIIGVTSWRTARVLAVMDFEEVLAASSYPMVPEIIESVDISGEPVFFPRFGPHGDRLYFDHEVGGESAIKYVEIDESFMPVTGTWITFLDYGTYCRQAGLFRPALPAYFPLLP